MRVKLLIVTLVFLSSGVAAQNVKGKIVDPADNKPIVGATVQLISLFDTARFFNTLSDNGGLFEYKNITADSFTLKVSSIGFEDYKQVVVVRDTSIDLGTLMIPKSVKQLGEVTVTSKTPPTQQKGDTIQYNASQFKVNPDANAEDMIKKVPGVTVDRQGTVTAQGEQVRKITIDGRDFFGDDATAALRNLPAEIIDKIQVFDRLSDQAQFTGFDDGNSQKAVNIVTKANMRNGQFGRLYAGYGTDNRYSAGGNVSFFKNNRRLSLVGLANNINQQNFSTQDLLGVTSSGGNRGGFGGGPQGGNRGGGGGPQGGNRGGGGNFGGGGQGNFLVGQQNGISKTNAIGINYSDQWGKKITISGSYFFNNSNNNNQQLTNRQITESDDSIFYYKENSLSSSNNYNHRMNLRFEYKIDSFNSIMITPNVSFQNNHSNSLITSASVYNSPTFDTAEHVNESTTKINSKTSGYNLNNNILYRHSFQKRGRTISVGLNTSYNDKVGDSYLDANTKYYQGGVRIDTLLQQFNDNETKGYTISSNIAYTEPVGKGQLQLNYNPSFTKNNSDQLTYQYDLIGDKYSLFDTTLSNKYRNTYTSHNGGISYRVGDRDKQFSVGLSVQHSKLSGEQEFPFVTTQEKTFTNLLPNLQLRRKISPMSSINIFFRTNVNAPSISQLQEVVNTTNPLQYSTGNPDLKQQYSASLVSRYTYTNTQKGKSFFANLYVQKTNDYISNATFITKSADSLLSSGTKLPANIPLIKPVNLDGYWSVRSFLTYGMPVKLIKSNINLNTSITYSRIPGLIRLENTITENFSYGGGAVIASNVSEFVDFNLSYNANYIRIVQSPTNNYFVQTAGVQFNLLSKKGLFFQNDLNHQSYNYKNAEDQNFWLWNLAVGQKFLKDQKGEVKLSVFDVLKQNKSITRTIDANVIEDVQSVVLRQYFMLTFTYKLKNFGSAPVNNRRNNDMRRDF